MQHSCHLFNYGLEMYVACINTSTQEYITADKLLVEQLNKELRL